MLLSALSIFSRYFQNKMQACSSNMNIFTKADSRNLPKVENVMLLEYIATSNKHNVAEIRGAKMLMSSRDSYLNTAVGYVQVSRSSSYCTVKAKIVPEHRINNKLYTVTCNIDEINDMIIDSVCEDCAAAAGGCKHSLLLLFWLEKKSSEPSSTATECYWNKPSLSSARTQHVLSKDIFKKVKKPKLADRDNSILVQFQEECVRRQIKNSLIINFDETRKHESKNIFDLMLNFIEESTVHDFENFKTYMKKIFSEEVIEEINQKTKGQSDSKYWHNIRQGRLTASKLHEAAHCKTADGSLVEQILGGYKIPETKAIQRGRKLEHRVLKVVEEKLNIEIKKSGFVLINGILGASPDGICDDFVVEVKCPSSEKTVKAYIKNNIIEDKFKVQLQCQMLACGKSKGIFCVADPLFESTKNVHILWENFDDDFIKNVINKAEDFWKNYIFPKLLVSAKNNQ